MESAVHAAVPLRVGKKMRKRRELDALVGGGGSRGGRLLSASSDEGEPWGRRAARRRRSRPFVRLAAALAFCVCVVSAATVLWLFVDVRRQIASLRVEMDRVSRSSNSVDDALQVCHTAAKELRANASDLSARLAKLEQEHLELEKRVEAAAKELSGVSEQLSAAPKLADTPRRLAELQRTVATFGSQINGFDSTISSSHKQALAAVAGVDEVRTLLHQLEAKTNETIANVSANTKRDEDIRTDIVSLNNTLTAKVETLQNRIQEISKPVSTAAPTQPPVVTAASAPPATNVTTSSLTTAVPPGKPAVLQ
ncbi:EF-hand calcium-binding domain-containing protein 14 isoform X1 [Trichoplusia ni]|uniref:EF-hand calcium-binding domain-containing protein 14 isoform X1 n=1 Tax=Trichoplusia ni TaxID=7111 RepID=A0A7E5WMM7_TRINI|nr:EF-hand calcium-binding domain-containing protein 14 isoform X1 [Trichoplusia ni]